MDNKAEAILDQALGEFNDALGGAKSKSSGKKKKGSNSASDPPAFEMQTAPADSSEAKV